MAPSCIRRRQFLGTFGICFGLLAVCLERWKRLPPTPNEETGTVRMKIFHGDIAAAFELVPDTDDVQQRSFVDAEHVLTRGQIEFERSLVDHGQNVIVEHLFAQLYGQKRDVLQLCKTGPSRSGIAGRPVPGAEWSAVSKLTCKVKLGPFASHPYTELQRFVLVQNDTHITLAVQQEGAIHTRHGDVNSHWLYTFSQLNRGGPVHVQALSVASDGALARRVNRFCRLAFADFIQRSWAALVGLDAQGASPLNHRTLPLETKLSVFNGDIETAFEAIQNNKGSPRAGFTPMQDILSKGVQLRDDAEFIPRQGKVPVEDLFPRLFGGESRFVHQYMAKQKGFDVEVMVVEPLEGAQWSAIAKMTCSIATVGGSYPYSEWKRFVLARNKTVISFVVQAISTVTVGKLIGDIKTETLYHFSEPVHGGGPVRLQTGAVEPTGPMKRVVMENYMKAATDFAETAKGVLMDHVLQLGNNSH